jgi:hypothetical protein
MSSPLPANWTVPQKFRDRLGAQAGKQRAMVDEGHLLLILHAPPDPGSPEKREGRLFWRSPDGGWRATGGGSVNVGALRRHVESFAEALEPLEVAVESARTADDYFKAVHALTPLVRTTRNLHHTLQAAREAVPGDKDLIALRDQAYDLERAADLLLVQARDGLDFMVARRAEEQSAQGASMIAASHRLNMLIALFLPITALGSLLGMNLRHGLEEWNAPWTFWVVAAAAFGIGYVVRSGLSPAAPST